MLLDTKVATVPLRSLRSELIIRRLPQHLAHKDCSLSDSRVLWKLTRRQDRDGCPRCSFKR